MTKVTEITLGLSLFELLIFCIKAGIITGCLLILIGGLKQK